MEKDIAVI